MNEPATMERLNVFILLVINVVTDGALILPESEVHIVSGLRSVEGGPCRSGFCCL